MQNFSYKYTNFIYEFVTIFVQNMGWKLHFQSSLEAQYFALISILYDIFDRVKKILKVCAKFVSFQKIYNFCDNYVSSRDYIVQISTLERFSKSQKTFAQN